MANKNEKSTGRYVYDKKTKKVVKISDEITSVSQPEPGGDCGGCCGNCPHGGH